MRNLILFSSAKILKIVLAVFFLLFSISTHVTSSAYAQGDPNTFACTWTGIECVVDVQKNKCLGGFSANKAACSGLAYEACLYKINIACIENENPDAAYYACILNQCQATAISCDIDPTAPSCYSGTTYDSVEACTAVCNPSEEPVKYTCVVGTGCVVDPNGTLDAGSAACKACAPVKDDDTKLIPNPAFNLCKQADNHDDCLSCASDGGVWTAIGCVPTTRRDITGLFLTLAISTSGGIVLLRVLQAAFMLSTSQGEQNKVQEARDILTSSIAGLLFILFSMVLLNTIGVSILQIPGF